MATSTARKVHENRLRRAAERQGLALSKSRRRDPRALDYDRYVLIDPHTNAIVAGTVAGRYGYTLDDVERHLLGADGESS